MFCFTYFLDKKRDREEGGPEEREKESFFLIFLFVGVDHAKWWIVDCGLWIVDDGCGWILDGGMVV